MKKITALMLAGVMALSMVACAPKEKPIPETDNPPAVEDNVESNAEAEGDSEVLETPEGSEDPVEGDSSTSTDAEAETEAAK